MTKTSSCPSDIEIQQFLEGVLSEIVSQRVDEHISICSECEMKMADFAKRASPHLNAAVEAIAGDIDDESLPYLGEELEFRGIIGKGGMGVVYKVWDRKLERLLALKTIRRRFAKIPPAIKRFLRERTTIALLQHPGVVPIHSSGELPDGRPFYTMKIVQGKTLLNYVRENPFRSDRFSEITRIIAAVAEVLSYSHSFGIAHRDIKPENVMIGEFGEVQVLDWGLARLEGSESPPTSESPNATAATTGVAGTISYMSPEQTQDSNSFPTYSSDVFALGGLLFFALASVPPRPEDVTLEEIRTRPIPSVRNFNRSVPRGLEAICKKALELAPENRYASADEFREDLVAFLDFRRIRAWKEPLLERIKRRSYRHSKVIWTGVSVALPILGLLAVAYFQFSRQLEEQERQQESIRKAYSDLMAYNFEQIDQYIKVIEARPLEIKEQLKSFFLMFSANRDEEVILALEQAIGDKKFLLAYYLIYAENISLQDSDRGKIVPDSEIVAMVEKAIAPFRDKSLETLNPDTLRLLCLCGNELGISHRRSDQFELAEVNLKFAIEGWDYLNGLNRDFDADSFTPLLSYANLLDAQGKKAEAQQQFRAVIEKIKAFLSTSDSIEANQRWQTELAKVYLNLGNSSEKPENISLYQTAREVLLKVMAGYPDQLEAMRTLVQVDRNLIGATDDNLQRKNLLAELERNITVLVSIERPSDSILDDLLTAQAALAREYERDGDMVEAEKYYLAAIETAELLSERTPTNSKLSYVHTIIGLRMNLALAYEDAGEDVAAVRSIEEIAQSAKLMKQDTPTSIDRYLATSEQILARILNRLGSYSYAEEVCRVNLSRWPSLLSAGIIDRNDFRYRAAESTMYLADSLHYQNKFDEANELYDQAFDALSDTAKHKEAEYLRDYCQQILAGRAILSIKTSSNTTEAVRILEQLPDFANKSPRHLVRRLEILGSILELGNLNDADQREYSKQALGTFQESIDKDLFPDVSRLVQFRQIPSINALLKDSAFSDLFNTQLKKVSTLKTEGRRKNGA